MTPPSGAEKVPGEASTNRDSIGTLGQSEKEIAKLEAQLADARRALEKIRHDKSLWKIRPGGADRYQGLPPAMRYIDAALSKLGGNKKS